MSTAPSPRRGPCAPARGLSRRTLLRAGLSAPLAGGPAAAARLQARPVPAVVWPRTCYRRFLVDTHIPDWHPDFLARFDAARFVGAMAPAGVQALMFYCNSYVGLALWRTKLAKPHANLRGRDLFGEIVAECRRRRIEPAKAARNFLAHASLLWAYDPLTSAPGTLTAGRATPLRASSDNRDAGEPGREAVQSIRAPAETGSNPAYPPT